jgi:AraC-like DNA-binding protein
MRNHLSNRVLGLIQGQVHACANAIRSGALEEARILLANVAASELPLCLDEDLAVLREAGLIAPHYVGQAEALQVPGMPRPRELFKSARALQVGLPAARAVPPRRPPVADKPRIKVRPIKTSDPKTEADRWLRVAGEDLVRHGSKAELAKALGMTPARVHLILRHNVFLRELRGPGQEGAEAAAAWIEAPLAKEAEAQPAPPPAAPSEACVKPRTGLASYPEWIRFRAGDELLRGGTFVNIASQVGDTVERVRAAILADPVLAALRGRDVPGDGPAEAQRIQRQEVASGFLAEAGPALARIGTLLALAGQTDLPVAEAVAALKADPALATLWRAEADRVWRQAKRFLDHAGEPLIRTGAVGILGQRLGLSPDVVGLALRDNPILATIRDRQGLPGAAKVARARSRDAQTQRFLDVAGMDLLRNGTLQEIGGPLGLSRERVRQIFMINPDLEALHGGGRQAELERKLEAFAQEALTLPPSKAAKAVGINLYDLRRRAQGNVALAELLGKVERQHEQQIATERAAKLQAVVDHANTHSMSLNAACWALGVTYNSFVDWGGLELPVSQAWRSSRRTNAAAAATVKARMLEEGLDFSSACQGLPVGERILQEQVLKDDDFRLALRARREAADLSEAERAALAADPLVAALDQTEERLETRAVVAERILKLAGEAFVRTHTADAIAARVGIQPALVREAIRTEPSLRVLCARPGVCTRTGHWLKVAGGDLIRNGTLGAIAQRLGVGESTVSRGLKEDPALRELRATGSRAPAVRVATVRKAVSKGPGWEQDRLQAQANWVLERTGEALLRDGTLAELSGRLGRSVDWICRRFSANPILRAFRHGSRDAQRAGQTETLLAALRGGATPAAAAKAAGIGRKTVWSEARVNPELAALLEGAAQRRLNERDQKWAERIRAVETRMVEANESMHVACKALGWDYRHLLKVRKRVANPALAARKPRKVRLRRQDAAKGDNGVDLAGAPPLDPSKAWPACSRLKALVLPLVKACPEGLTGVAVQMSAGAARAFTGSALESWLRGRYMPSETHLATLCAFLGVPREWF